MKCKKCRSYKWHQTRDYNQKKADEKPDNRFVSYRIDLKNVFYSANKTLSFGVSLRMRMQADTSQSCFFL